MQKKVDARTRGGTKEKKHDAKESSSISSRKPKRIEEIAKRHKASARRFAKQKMEAECNANIRRTSEADNTERANRKTKDAVERRAETSAKVVTDRGRSSVLLDERK